MFTVRSEHAHSDWLST